MKQFFSFMCVWVMLVGTLSSCSQKDQSSKNTTQIPITAISRGEITPNNISRVATNSWTVDITTVQAE